MTASSIFELNRRLARTINLGNALEAPNEGDWGVTLQESYFVGIAEAGFTAVRVPIRFSGHAGNDFPYTIDPRFFERIDWVVGNATRVGLTVILDLHHHGELFENPSGERMRFLALWQQIAARYREVPDEQVFFEPLNEPNGKLTPAAWNELFALVLPVLRAENPTRPVIVDAAEWGNARAVPALELPADPNLILSFHYYEPFEFTHQGADWMDGSQAWLGTPWEGTPEQLTILAQVFDPVAAWAEQENVPVFVGEFGTYEQADLGSRVRWTQAIRQAAEQRGFAWGYWEFCAGFGVYDPLANRWRHELLQALIP
jgi:endoglucanase